MNNNNLPKSAKEARASGSKYYFTQKPCKHGHVSKRLTKTSHCVVCASLKYHKRKQKLIEEFGEEKAAQVLREQQRNAAQEYRDSHKEQNREYMQAYMQAYRKTEQGLANIASLKYHKRKQKLIEESKKNK